MNKTCLKDQKLISQILDNKKSAIDFFYNQFQPGLKTYLLKKTSNNQDAEDITQETIIAALKSLPGFKFKSSLFSWLCAIANHELVDFYRKKKIKTILLKSELLETIASRAMSPEDHYLKNELKTEIKKALKNLTEGYFKILRLKYIEQLTMRAIAQKMDLTIKAVESRLSRARSKFRQEWRKQTSKKLLNSPF